MSGGHWNYKSDHLAWDIFGFGFSPDYGDKGFMQSKAAACLNPLEDHEMSEMLWDMLCILHSYDWYASGDTGEETCREDVQRFKDKWLGKTKVKDRIKRVADIELERVRKELYRTFGIRATKEDDHG